MSEPNELVIAPRVAITPVEPLRTWSADCWRCRYCEELVFFAPAFRVLARRFGNHGYFHPNWKPNESPLLIKRGASIDHVLAVTRGGQNTLDNYVSACWECNLAKSNDAGWTPTPRQSSSWDGLLAAFVGLARSGDYVPDATDKKWLHAVETLGLAKATSISTS